MLDDCAEMLFRRVAVGFARLRHHVANINAQRFRNAKRVRERLDGEIREHGRVERARSDENQIGIRDCVEHALRRLRIGRFDSEMNDARVTRRRLRRVAEMRAADRDFADDFRAIGERRAQPDIGKRRRINLAADRENF